MKIDLDFIPSTIENAVDTIIDSLSFEDKGEILKNLLSVSVHHTIGRYLRNSWSLWNPDTPLKRDAVNTYGIAHADDISGLIIEWTWAKVLEIEFDPLVFVKKYHQHWARCGMTSLEANGWPWLN